MIPNPKRATSKWERNWWCPRYHECLDLGAEKGWSNWRCNECEYKNERVKITIEITTDNGLPYYTVNKRSIIKEKNE